MKRSTAINCFLSFLFLTIIFVLASSTLRAQVFYANTYNSINEIFVGPSGCAQKPSKFSCPEANNDIFSIAYFHDTMYVGTESKLFYTTGNKPGSCIFLSDWLSATSLVAAPDGSLYAAIGDRIISYDPHSKQMVLSDPMPFNSTGDLVFYKNKLYMAADGGFIIEVNLDSPALSKKIMQLSETEIFGLAISPGRCGNDQVYALSIPFDSTSIILLDIDHQKELGVLCVLDNIYLDAASPAMDEEPPAVTIDSIGISPACELNTFKSTVNILAYGATGSTLNYSLDNGMQNTTGTFANLDVGTYKLHISTSSTCFIDTSFIVGKQYCDKLMIVPNAFTPNHDGRNDVLRPLGLIPPGSRSFMIFNRYGQKVFETTDFSKGWDGTIKGIEQSTGTYVWLLRYTNSEGKIITQKGTTVLIR